MVLTKNAFDGFKNLREAIESAAVLPPSIQKDKDQIEILFTGSRRQKMTQVIGCMNLLDYIGCKYRIETENGIVSTRNNELDKLLYKSRQKGIGLENGKVVLAYKIKYITVIGRKAPEVNLLATERYGQVGYQMIVHENNENNPFEHHAFSGMKPLRKTLEDFVFKGVPQPHKKLNAIYYRVTSKVDLKNIKNFSEAIRFYMNAEASVDELGDAAILKIDGFFETLIRPLNQKEKIELSDLISFKEVENAEKT